MHVSIRGTCDDFHFSAHVFTLTFFKLSQQIFPEKQGGCSFSPLPAYSRKKLATSLAKEELTIFNPKFCPPNLNDGGLEIEQDRKQLYF